MTADVPDQGRRDDTKEQPCAYVLGESFERRVFIDDAAIRQFAAEAGDDNPMHHDTAYARSTRFGGLIASGAHGSALLIGCAGTFVTRKGEALGLEFAFKFRQAIAADQTVTMTWRIVELFAKASLGGHVAKLEGELRLESGIVAITAHGSAVIMETRAPASKA